jgi:AraC family L-rhamnose operon transcriptional activator RhaR
MTVFESTTVNDVDLRMPGLHLRSFALHRPAADRSVLRPHAKSWSRAVFFLEGAGRQAEPGTWQPSAGTVVILTPGHCDERQGEIDALPLCLVLDFRLSDEIQRAAVTCMVRREELLRAREQLAYLLRLQAENGADRACESAVVVLNVLVILLRTAGWLRHEVTANHAAGESAMHRLLLTMPLESPLGFVVQRSGYQRDHLNRLIKRETGLTLGQFRTQRRLDRAKELLARGVKVGDVAGEIGLPDQSYFARWFRRQTGLAPSQWLQIGGMKPPLNLAMCG